MDFIWDNKSVLVVEDEEVNFRLIEKMLEFTQVSIHRAIKGQEALDLIANGLYVDLVLMDLQLPDMDGFQVTEELKQKYPDLPIIAHTFVDTGDLQEKIQQSKLDGLLHKPLNMNKFLVVLDRFL